MPRKLRNGKTTWQVQWTFRDSESGELERGYRTVLTQAAGLQGPRLTQVSIEAGQYVALINGTVAEWLKLWMAGTVFGDLAPQTQRAYRRHVSR